MSKRMIDTLIHDGCPLVGGQLQEAIRNAEVFIVDHVSDYYYQQGEQGIMPSHFPNCAPPFPLFWMESRRPQCTFQKPFFSLGYAWGFLFSSIELNDLSFDQRQQFLEGHFPTDRPGLQVVSPMSEARWAYHIMGFLHTSPHEPINPWKIHSFFLVQANKAFIQVRDANNGMKSPYAHFASILPNDATPWKHSVPLIENLLLPFWLAIAFLHCKNVITAQVDPCHPQGKKKASMPCKRVHYHTLDIHPMREILRREGKQESTGLKHALHSCRGHFRDYSQGRGLFGKHQGLYWFDQHLRGSSTHGVSVKDYLIYPQ